MSDRDTSWGIEPVAERLRLVGCRGEDLMLAVAAANRRVGARPARV